MRITDLRRYTGSQVFECAICVVGSGPAGLTIASELGCTAHDVLVVESGGRTREESFAQGLNEIESVGMPRQMDQSLVRNRVLGGSSYSWFGRCAALDAMDYEARTWVPYSGWPVTAEEMAPYVQRSAAYLGLGAGLYAGGLAEPAEGLRFAQAGVRPVFWQFSSELPRRNDYVRFGTRFQKLQATNLHVLVHATVTQILLAEDGRAVTGVEVTTPEGVTHTVLGRRTVLCAGGIENARTLLASNRKHAAGVGNKFGRVGRFFMDHPRATVGTFAAAGAAAVQQRMGLFRTAAGARVQSGLSLSLQVQRDERLLNCAAWTTQHVAADDVWRLLRALSRAKGAARLQALRQVASNADQAVTGLWQKLVLRQELTRRLEHLDLDVMVEQAPNPESRIRLSPRQDRLGVGLSEIDWKISEMERLSVIRLAHAVNAALRGAGLPEAKLVDWVRNRKPEHAFFSDPAHPLGATRMAGRPEDGVVDRDCKVFGVENLYIAGSSVFATGGHANPTLTVVALALRLADTLKAQANVGF